MTKTELAKRAINIAVTIGTGKIVGDIIKNNTNPDPDSLADKVTYRAGGMALGGVVAAETSKYTDAQVDEITAWWNENVKKKN